VLTGCRRSTGDRLSAGRVEDAAVRDMLGVADAGMYSTR
jgi:hypothetical protein